MGSGGGGGGGGDEEQTQLQTLDQLLRSVLPDGGDHPFPRRGANSGGGAPCRRTAEGEWKNRQRRRERSRDQSRPKQRAVEGMTLEDFLSMEVVTGENPEKNSAQRRRQRAEQNVAAAAAAAAYSQSCTSPEPLVMGPGEMVERTVERRQKRMMKNRESAARSRARKQAYTNELENKISRLEEENERLRKQKEMEAILYNMPLPELRIQLRRTSSSPL